MADADLFTHLLAQYRESIAVVQPLLPSLFAPASSLTLEATLSLADDQPGEDAETAPLVRTLLEREDLSVPAAGETNAWAQEPASAPPAPGSKLPEDISSRTIRRLLSSPRPVRTHAEAGQQAKSAPMPETLSGTPFSLHQPLFSAHNREREGEEEAALPGIPIFSLPEGPVLASSETQQTATAGEKQRQPLQKDEPTGQSDRASHKQVDLFAADAQPIPLTETSAIVPLRTLPQEPAPASPLRSKTASRPVVGEQETAEKVQAGEFAERETELREQAVFTPAQGVSSPDPVPPLQVRPLADTQNALLASSLPLIFEEAERPASVPLQELAREMPARERQEEAKQEPVFPAVPELASASERPGAEIFLRQDRAESEEDYESLSVRIHIGRVVVRGAANSPTSAPTPSTRRVLRPALSLSDYLKQRERGDR